MKKGKNNLNSLKKKIDTTIRKLEKSKTTENKSLINLLKEISQFQIEPKLINEAIFRTTLYSIGDAVITTDIKGNIQQMNPIAEKLCGWKEADAKNKPLEKVFNIISEATGKKTESTFKKIIKTGKIVGLENDTLLISKSGKKIPITDSSAPIKNDKAEIMGIVLVFRDQTEERLNQTNLEERERKFSTLLSNLPGFTYRCLNDKNWTMKFISDGCKEITGYSPNDLINNKNIAFNDVIVPKYHKPIWEKWQRILKDKSFFEFEYPIICKNKKIKWVWERGRGIYSTSGKLLFLEGFIEDITERYKTEELLQESEHRYKTFFDNAPDAIFLADPESGKIIDVNKEALRLLKLPYSKVIKMHQSQLHPKRLKTYSTKTFKEQFRTIDLKIPVENFLVTATGEEIPVEVLASILTLNGKKVLQGVFRNISERRKIEAEFQKSKERMQLLIEGTPNLFFYIQNLKGNIEYISPSVENITGYSVDKWLNQNHWFVSDSPINQKAKDRTRNHLDGNIITEPVYVEILHANGSKVMIEVYERPIFKNRIVVGLQGVAHDITKRLQAEQNLRESESSYSRLFDSVSEAIYILDENGIFTDINTGALNMYGYERDELIGKTPEYVSAPGKNDLESLAVSLGKAFNGEKQQFEFWGKRKNGEEFLKDVRLYPGNYFNKIVIIAIANDITEKKKAEILLRESEKRYKLIAENTADSIAIFDLNLNYTYISPSVIKLLGYTAEELMKIGLAKIVSQVDLSNMQKTLLEELENETIGNADKLRSRIIQLQQIRKDGTKVWVEATVSFLRDDKGAPVGILAVSRNITDRKKVEDALALSEERYRAISNLTSDYLFSTQIGAEGEHQIVWIAGSFERITGYTVDEYRKAGGWRATLHPDELELDKLDLEQLKRNKKVNREIRTYHKNGSVVWVRSFAQPIWDDQNKKLLGVYGAVEDITKRKQTEILQMIQYKIADAVVSYKTLTELFESIRKELSIIINVNNFFIALYDETTGMLKSDVDKDEVEEISEWEAKGSMTGYVIEQKKSVLLSREEIHQLINSGNAGMIGVIPEIWLGVPFKIGGKVIGVLVVQSYDNPKAYDNSSIEILEIVAHELSIYIQHKKAEEETLKLSVAIVQSPVSIVITDPNGNFEYVNPKFTEISGYGLDEVKGKNPRILNSGEHPKEFFTHLWTTITNGQNWKGEIRNRKKDGSLYWENALISPIINTDGMITNFVAVKEDITDKKKMIEELIVAKEKAEEMNRVKSSFFANMSHELRTPMVGILGFSEFLMNELKDNPSYFTMANSINVSGHRLLETLNLILNLSKLEASKVEVNIKAQNILPLLKESFGFFESAAKKKTIEYSFSTEQEEIICNVDQLLFSSIFNNLINNAIKFTDSGKVTITVTTDLESVNILVADTGVGISDIKQNLIWEEFRQASEGYNRGFEGTGLGLTIAKKYADLMKGDITVKSSLGKGTTFNVTFPLSNSASTQSNLLNNIELNKPVESIQQNPQIKILYVEDDEISVKYVTTVTKTLFDVDSANDSDEALSKIKQNKYDVILMDINLRRGMDGVELTKVIRKIDGYKSIPIIAITAFAMGKEQEEFLSQGMTHYLSKPFVKAQLLNMLDSAINKK